LSSRFSVCDGAASILTRIVSQLSWEDNVNVKPANGRFAELGIDLRARAGYLTIEIVRRPAADQH